MTARTPRKEGPSSRSSSATSYGKKSPHPTSLNPLDRLATEESDIEVVATCHNEEYPPENVLEQNTTSFWATTGLYPHELFLGFREEIRVAEIKIVSSEIRTISIDRVIPNQSEVTQNLMWKRILSLDMPRNEGQLQKETHKVNNLAIKYLKIVIEAGHDRFSAIYSINLRTPEGKWLIM
eukprot:Phypoly_transcript_23167.p1 GENE.Phypoly_transcript_23167~~Phypoly_transcript_23167.p1  ORF type:complete len:180 (+),score=22.10 Phypoly_transcript_23167:25-564(+)